MIEEGVGSQHQQSRHDTRDRITSPEPTLSARSRLAIALLTASTLAACTSLLGNDFSVDDGAGGATNATSGNTSSTSTGSDGGGGMMPLECSNMVRDGGETDIDCGGTCLTKCEVGEGCSLGSDCVTGNCGDSGLCAPPPPCGGMCESWQACESDVCTPGAIFHVNLEGGTFSYGADDDASLGIQQVSSEALPSTMASYGGTEFDKMAIFDAIAASFQAFNVEVTRVPPPSGTPYQMVVVTPSGSALVPSRKLWAPSPDCGDQDDNNMAFVIFSAQSSANEGVSPSEQATVASKAIGIMLGLEPVTGASDIMHNTIAGGGSRSFEDFCHGKPPSDTWVCNAAHMASCSGNSNLQNSYAELDLLFGAPPS